MVNDIRPVEPNVPTAEPTQTETNVPDTEPAFVPPELVESEEGSIGITQEDNAVAPAKQSLKDRIKNKLGVVSYKDATKKQKIIGAVIIAVLLIAGSGGIYALRQHMSKAPAPAPAPAKAEVVPPPPTTEASKLSGVEVPIGTNTKPIKSIQIENSPDARPQSALKDAGVVFEAIAEGGITRFNASFLETQPDYIGPIRSVRPYYAALAAPFDPIFVHAGGSGEGLAKISELGLKDLDHGANGGAFSRASDRFAPHNLYSTTAALDQVAAERGYTTSNAKSFLRKKEELGKPAAARVVDMTISSGLYNVHYDYAAETNSYNRVMGGTPHTDHRSGVQISPKVVIALAMPYSQNGIYSVYGYNGTGPGTIFQDGQAIAINWTKAGDKEQLVFTDAAGQPVAINPGQTWITLLKGPEQVTFGP